MSLNEIIEWMCQYAIVCLLKPDFFMSDIEPTPAEFLALADWTNVPVIATICHLLAEEGPESRKVRQTVAMYLMNASQIEWGMISDSDDPVVQEAFLRTQANLKFDGWDDKLVHGSGEQTVELPGDPESETGFPERND